MKKQDFEFLTSIAKKELGWEFSKQHYYIFDQKITQFLREKNYKNIDFLMKELRSGNKLLIEQLNESLAHVDTSFFRDHEIFKKFRTIVLPNIKQSYKKAKRLNVWSCGCSSGQEAYSILICLKDNNMLEGWQTSVIGTDFSSKPLADASKGYYNNFDIQTGLNIKDIVENFDQKGENWQIKPEFLQHIEFRKYNLLNTPLFNNKFDIVFCRNTIKYFTPENQKDIIKKIHATQNSGGLLYIGLDENIYGIKDFYEKLPGFDCLYQAKKL